MRRLYERMCGAHLSGLRQQAHRSLPLPSRATGSACVPVAV